MIVRSDQNYARHGVICIHIGARAHYLIPKALQASGSLHTLITDTWIGSSFLRKLLNRTPFKIFRSLAGRYTSDIPSSAVRSFGWNFMLYDILLRLWYSYSWSLILARDRRFQSLALSRMDLGLQPDAVLGISYTSLKCFDAAASKGVRTILFQIDPGPEEERIVSELVYRYKYNTSWQKAPQIYWEQWKQECLLADAIMVNSEWSKSGLVKEGIDEHKIKIISLPFELEEKHEAFIRKYPEAFTVERPLRCLFLGTLTLRKGIHIVLEAAAALTGLPIEFVLVGRSEIPEDALAGSNVCFKGVATRQETELYYQDADVFLFPTLSDGFGLTQLEAMAWQLPVIATERCGDVVMENHNGWRIDPSNVEELVKLLRHIIFQPSGLKKRSEHCLETVKEFSIARFSEEIVRLV